MIPIYSSSLALELLVRLIRASFMGHFKANSTWLGSNPPYFNALQTMNYDLMTSVQEQTLPSILDGKDVLVSNII